MTTNLPDAAIEPFVTEFNTFRKGAAEHTIRQHKVIFRAKDKLDERDFVRFCDTVGLEPKSSKCRKFLKIGAEADWLLPMSDKLPADWTKIYDVAVLGQDKAEMMIQQGVLHPKVKGRELKADATGVFADEASNTSATDEMPDTVTADDDTGSMTETCIFRIDASDLSDQDRLVLYMRLESASAPYGLTVVGLPERLAERVIIEREAA